MTDVFDAESLSTRPSAVTKSEKSRHKSGKFWLAVGGGLALLSYLAGSTGYGMGQNSRDNEVASAEALGRRSTEIALTLGRAGFTNVVGVRVDDSGPPTATLSLDPTSPNACHITFYVSSNFTALTLNQLDAEGHSYGRITASSGQEARQAMAQLCMATS